MLKGLRTLTIGYHSLLFHTIFVTLSWKRIYNKYPNCREFICILLHDIGYINQNIREDKHPELGAKICGKLFGKEYYNLCISHSRDYAKKLNIPISKLCYADKYAVNLISWRIHKLIYHFDSPEVTIKIILDFRKSCRDWWKENDNRIK